MNTLFLETKEDAISFANEINETFWKFGKEAATDSAFGWKFRIFRTQEVFDAFEREFDKKNTERSQTWVKIQTPRESVEG